MIRVAKLKYRSDLEKVVMRFGAIHHLRRQDLAKLTDARLEQVARRVLLAAEHARRILER